MINLDALAGRRARRALELAGDRPRSPATSLVATAARRIVEQTGVQAAASGLRRAADRPRLPVHALRAGAVRRARHLRGHADDRRQPAAAGVRRHRRAACTRRRSAQLGTPRRRSLGSLDQGLELAQGTTSYVWFGNRIVRGWAIELVLIALLVPFLVGAVDLFALCRRRRIALAPALRALRSGSLFWLFVGIVFTCFAALGAWPDGPAAAAEPGDRPPPATGPCSR